VIRLPAASLRGVDLRLFSYCVTNRVQNIDQITRRLNFSKKRHLRQHLHLVVRDVVDASKLVVLSELLQAESEASTVPDSTESKASVCGLARKNSSRLSRSSTSASLVTILSDGWRLPASKCPTYGVETLILAAISSCVRSSSLRLLRITSPKLNYSPAERKTK
jgi:hypothetical protein